MHATDTERAGIHRLHPLSARSEGLGRMHRRQCAASECRTAASTAAGTHREQHRQLYARTPIARPARSLCVPGSGRRVRSRLFSQTSTHAHCLVVYTSRPRRLAMCADPFSRATMVDSSASTFNCCPIESGSLTIPDYTPLTVASFTATVSGRATNCRTTSAITAPETATHNLDLPLTFTYKSGSKCVSGRERAAAVMCEKVAAAGCEVERRARACTL